MGYRLAVTEQRDILTAAETEGDRGFKDIWGIRGLRGGVGRQGSAVAKLALASDEASAGCETAHAEPSATSHR
jgi:hypothetical protein